MREQSCSAIEAVEPHMGTLVRITLYATGEQAAKDAFRAAFDRIRDLDRILSDYRPDSELNQITRTAVARAVPVSEDLFTVLAEVAGTGRGDRRRVRHHAGTGHPAVARSAEDRARARSRRIAGGGRAAAASQAAPRRRHATP